jgi:excisionase family DNA binding protein
MEIGLNTNHKYITTAELAELLRMSETSVYRLVDKGEIRFYKPSWKILFDITDVNEYMAKKCFKPIV